MDFVTHAAVGALVGRAMTPAEADSRTWVRLGALAALLPDADHVLELVSAEAYVLQHRMLSHSLLGVTAIALAVAWRGEPEERGRRVAVAAAALATHLVLDVATPFGTGLLWPFSDWLAHSDGLPIVAPWLTLLSLALAGVAAWRARGHPSAGRRAAWGGLVALGALLTWTHFLAWRGAAALPGEPPQLCVPTWRFPLAADALRIEGEEVVHYRVSPWGSVREEQRFPRFALPPGAERPARTFAQRPELPLRRLRVPVASLEGEEQVYMDAQYLLIDPTRKPISIRAWGERDHAFHMMVRGPQLALWAAVLALSMWLTRGSRD